MYIHWRNIKIWRIWKILRNQENFKIDLKIWNSSQIVASCLSNPTYLQHTFFWSFTRLNNQLHRYHNTSINNSRFCIFIRDYRSLDYRK